MSAAPPTEVARELGEHLDTLRVRDHQRAALLRRYGFRDLAEAYDDGSQWAEQARLRLGHYGLLGRAETHATAGTTLPQRDRMQALTRLVRGDLAQNRRRARDLGRLADRAEDDVQTQARAAQAQVVDQTARLSADLRRRLTDWSRGVG